MIKFSFLKSTNVSYIDQMLEQYLENPNSVEDSWKCFFDGFELGTEMAGSGPDFHGDLHDFSAEAKVAELITAYRERGHLLANINPLESPPKSHPLLDLNNFQLSEADLDREFTAGNLIGIGPAPLREILARLHTVYCSSIGVEYTHIQDPVAREWLQKRMESSGNQESLDTETKKRILKRLTDSETFETFLHTRYVAQKRFSLEGGEGLITILDRIIEKGADLGVNNVVMGMAHRGRLNVLVNIYGKKPELVLTEFEEAYESDDPTSAGDVKYHKGFSSDIQTPSGKPVHLSLAHNPSHLEFVNPVVEGIARAKQRLMGDTQRTQVLPIVIHGDAAFAGQGVVYETLNLAHLKGYSVGGTVHVVINNQVGFTTDPADSRSTKYCTDLAKMLESPIFHVNGDDPEALWFVSALCTEYRQKFQSDVFIDQVCYRKYGHNEGDEPSFTQPLMYQKIKAHTSPRQVYATRLLNAGVVNETQVTALVDAVNAHMTQAQQITRTERPKPFVSAYEGKWKELTAAKESDILNPAQTTVPEKLLKELGRKLAAVPSDFKPHPKLVRFIEGRLKSIEDGQGIDWGNGETLAYATLLQEGNSVRISGQDVQRGTFSHRHAVLHDPESGKTWTPLDSLKSPDSTLIIQNSHLSETAVLGFEYGWSLADPQALVVWEAQFGDFANGAQVIIDQFISTSESKWQRASGIVLLLPHSYEGQGPEHSSARLERFLQLCGQNNMIVGNFTTPAQLFHALRRQLKRNFRKPLVVMSPKSLLRHPKAISQLRDFSDMGFQEVLDDHAFIEAKKAHSAERILLCSGKVYYDLLAAREAHSDHSILNRVALLRVEQLYPWPVTQISSALARYAPNADICWVQEEPRNMGAWTFVYSNWSGAMGDSSKINSGTRSIRYIGRDISAAPAVGSHKRHDKEQEDILEKAFKF